MIAMTVIVSDLEGFAVVSVVTRTMVRERVLTFPAKTDCVLPGKCGAKNRCQRNRRGETGQTGQNRRF